MERFKLSAPPAVARSATKKSSPGVKATTRLMGLLGADVRHADLAFAFNNKLLSYWGNDFLYVPYSVPADQLGDAVKGLRALNVLSCNVTLPHKVSILEHLDEVEETTGLMGSVNLVVNREGTLWGYNTDSRGFMDALRSTGLLADLHSALIYGAGGAGRAIAAALALAGVEWIWIYDIVEARGFEVEARLRAQGLHVVAARRKEVCGLRPALVVNATPVGLGHQAGQSPLHELCIGESARLFFDLNYNPARSTFLQQGESLGAAVENGLRMMCYQAKHSIEIAAGETIPTDWFAAAVEAVDLARSLVYAGNSSNGHGPFATL